MRGLENRIAKLEERAGSSRIVLLACGGELSAAEIRERVTTKAKAERVPERNVHVIHVPWLNGNIEARNS